MTESIDAPKTLKSEDEQKRRIGLLGSPHIKPLTDFAASVRAERGTE
jgi:hypothetical protein